MNPLQLLIVDDHPIFRKGLKCLLEPCEEIGKVIIAENFEAINVICQFEKIDLVIMDINLGSHCGAELTQRLKRFFPKIKIIACSTHQEKEYIFKMMEAGASGYLLKDIDIEELKDAIQQVSKGKTFLSSSITKGLTSFDNQKQNTKALEDKLTIREIEILTFIIRDELSNKEIANRLFISPRTVETHKRNLIQKLQVKNTVGLAKFYFENNLSITVNYGIPLA